MKNRSNGKPRPWHRRLAFRTANEEHFVDFITAVVPVYNRFEYLNDCLESVFGQTRPPDEVLIVDDCSTASVREYLATTPFENRVTVLRTDRNRRVAGARNWGWKHAQGNLIAFIDSDDIWEPHKTEMQLRYLGENPDADGGTQPWAHDRPPTVTVENALIDCNISVQTLMIRRAALERIDGFDEDFGILDDQDVAIRLALDDLRIDFMAHPAVARLRRNESNYSRKARVYFREDLMIHRRYRALMDEVYGPGSSRVHLARLLVRYGRKVRLLGLPARVAARLLAWSAPRSRMPRPLPRLFS
jgi:glycosyltransferase involved in cell wall biosynthesis